VASGSAANGPSATAGPTVIGTAAAGKRLSGLSGNWAGFGRVSYHFQWYRCNAAGAACLSVHGATSPSYALVDRDVGKTLGLTVSASDSTGTTSAYSSLVGPIAPRRPLLESTVQPSVMGPPVEGKTVQVTTGTWSPVPASLAYRWTRCNSNGRACAAIPNAIGTSYTIAPADLGHTLVAIVQGKNGSTIQNSFSTSTPAVVSASVHRPTFSVGPSVAGTAVEGQQLSAATGIWKGVGPIAFGFRWYRCDDNGGHCARIGGAGSATYTLHARDIGATIALTVAATDSVGTAVAYASLIGPVAAGDAALTPISLPTISGTTRIGETLTITSGAWTTSPSRFTYAWLRCNQNGRLCAPIPGATAASYKPTSEDAGHTLVASIVAAAAGSTQAALTVATAPVVS
jgi:hypothetical protein